MIVFGGSERLSELAGLLLATIGAWWVYVGIATFFPTRYFRAAYRRTGLAKEVFKATINHEGIEITSDKCDWRIRWPGVVFKGEDKRVFIFLSYATLFVFGKKYLNSENESQIRRLSGLSTS